MRGSLFVDIIPWFQECIKYKKHHTKYKCFSGDYNVNGLFPIRF